jgi:hypothetical protein
MPPCSGNLSASCYLCARAGAAKKDKAAPAQGGVARGDLMLGEGEQSDSSEPASRGPAGVAPPVDEPT